jgi:hypothetical protein
MEKALSRYSIRSNREVRGQSGLRKKTKFLKLGEKG